MSVRFLTEKLLGATDHYCIIIWSLNGYDNFLLSSVVFLSNSYLKSILTEDFKSVSLKKISEDFYKEFKITNNKEIISQKNSSLGEKFKKCINQKLNISEKWPQEKKEEFKKFLLDQDFNLFDSSYFLKVVKRKNLDESLEILDNKLDEIDRHNWIWNEDGTVDVDGDLNLSWRDLVEIPYKFRKVQGNFDCSGNLLTSLANAPTIVTGNFDVKYNFNIKSLDWQPEYIGGEIFLGVTYIINIANIFPQDKYRMFVDSITLYDYLRGDKIIKVIFDQMCRDFGISPPEEISGFEFI